MTILNHSFFLNASIQITIHLLLTPTIITSHSWIESLESPYGKGMSRIGMPTKSDEVLIRYFCPHENLDDCQVDAKHNVILTESSKRPCRPDMVSDPKTPTRPGSDVLLSWAGNGHVNEQSDGTCVTVMIAPFAADPSINDFVPIPGAECLPFWIMSDRNGGESSTQEPEGTITIPADLDPGQYTLFWVWNFTVFHYSSCADIEVLDDDDTSYEEDIEHYLGNGCSDLCDPDHFCEKYSGLGVQSYCDEMSKDDCGRSSCHGLDTLMLLECVDCPPQGPPGCPSPKPFYDDFLHGFDPNKWLKAHKTWNLNSGGVVSENVHFDVASKKVILTAHGLNYNGDVMGVTKGAGGVILPKDSGVMTGAAIATRDYFGAGSYEIRMKVAEEMGVCSAIWTFFYDDTANEASGAPIINHEIDIELPGRPAAPHTDIGFDYVLMNTWVGEIDSLYETNYTQLDSEMNDGQFHTWKFDWHTDESDRRVEFYLDGKLFSTNRNHVPFYAGRLWIGAWFPNHWAGVPNFDISSMEVDYVKFTPFEGEVYECPPESYPYYGWAPDTIFTTEDNEEPQTPVKCKTPVTPTAAPTPVPTPPTHAPAPIPSPTPPPVSTPVENTPELRSNYLSNGCNDLPTYFCENEMIGSYCKTWQNDESACQRSICQGHDFTLLHECAAHTPSEEETYQADGCEQLQDRDAFCVGYIGSGSYCKYWGRDHCQRAICQGDDFSSLNPC